MDNRHLLHRFDTGLFVDFGHPSALKYVYGRWTGSFWQAGATDDGRPVAWTDGVRSLFHTTLFRSVILPHHFYEPVEQVSGIVWAWRGLRMVLY